MDNNNLPINTIIISVKDYIFRCSRLKSNPTFLGAREKLRKHYEEQTLLFTDYDKLEKVRKSWASFAVLFN